MSDRDWTTDAARDERELWCALREAPRTIISTPQSSATCLTIECTIFDLLYLSSQIVTSSGDTRLQCGERAGHGTSGRHRQQTLAPCAVAAVV